MPHSATRLTCFALISALEQDLRTHIEDLVFGPGDASRLTPDETNKARERYNREHGGRPEVQEIKLIQYLDFADSIQVLNRHAKALSHDLRDQIYQGRRGAERLTPVRNRVAHSRPLEFDDLPTVLDYCTDLCNGSTKKNWPTLNSTLDELSSNPAHVLTMKINLISDPDPAPMNNLPPPDFDETGFFGRAKQIRRVKRIIKSGYPVVSILGDGGIGKTALALKVAYDLLDDPAAGFDAFIWVTAKSQRLTTNEIQRVNGAIENSLGLFAEATRSLSGEAQSDPQMELLEYLEHFRIFLILDNLETVLDQRLREFLLEIPLGSKVMLTSRIGVGVENPVSLEPLDRDDSIKLLYSLARIRDIPAVLKLNNTALGKVVDTIGGRPAYIKWFVSGVQAGRRPEELLTKDDLFLEFCMSNVHGFLGPIARQLLQCLQVLPGPRTHAELSYLTDMNAQETQSGILELITTNYVNMGTGPTGDAIETCYELSDFGRRYLDKHHPVPTSVRREILSRNRKHDHLGLGLLAEYRASPFNAGTVYVRNHGDFGAARHLHEALKLAASGQYNPAMRLCEEARILSPTYFETWRVEAYIHSLEMNPSSARSAYERALELTPDSVVTSHYFFGMFLLDEGIDLDLALRHLQLAARRAPDSAEILVNIAWAHLLREDYEDSIEAAGQLLKIDSQNNQASIAAGILLRASIYYLSRDHGTRRGSRSIELLETVVDICDALDDHLVDGERCDRIIQLSESCSKLHRAIDDDFLARKVREFEGRLIDRVRRADPALLERRQGTVASLHSDKAYGFIRLDRTDYFFHLRDLCVGSDWDHLAIGSAVGFQPDPKNPRGPRARDVTWLG